MLRFDERTDVSAADGLDPVARAQVEASGKQGFCKFAKVFDGDARLKALVDGTAS